MSQLRIDKIEELEMACKKEENLILYGAGVVAGLVVQHLLKEGFSEHMFCMAVSFLEGNPDNILGLPVCNLADLSEYKKDSLFLVASYEKIQPEIIRTLSEFGCERIATVSNLLCAVLRKRATDFSVETYNLLWQQGRRIQRMEQELSDRLEHMEALLYDLQEQNEISRVNTEAFEGYENCFRDRDVVILASGPTFNYYKPIENAVHIGINTAYKQKKVALDYLFTQDASRQLEGEDYNFEEYYKGLKEVSCEVFIGRYLRSYPWNYIGFPEEYRLPENVHSYYTGPKTKYMYRDIRFHPLMDFQSIIFPAVHFALFTYPKRIFIVGHDILNVGEHFCGSNGGTIAEEEKTFFVREWIEGWKKVKEFAEFYYPETEIISINPIGLKGMFRDIYTDDFLKKEGEGKPE